MIQILHQAIDVKKRHQKYIFYAKKNIIINKNNHGSVNIRLVPSVGQVIKLKLSNMFDFLDRIKNQQTITRKHHVKIDVIKQVHFDQGSELFEIIFFKTKQNFIEEQYKLLKISNQFLRYQNEYFKCQSFISDIQLTIFYIQTGMNIQIFKGLKGLINNEPLELEWDEQLLHHTRLGQRNIQLEGAKLIFSGFYLTIKNDYVVRTTQQDDASDYQGFQKNLKPAKPFMRMKNQLNVFKWADNSVQIKNQGRLKAGFYVTGLKINFNFEGQYVTEAVNQEEIWIEFLNMQLDEILLINADGFYVTLRGGKIIRSLQKQASKIKLIYQKSEFLTTFLTDTIFNDQLFLSYYFNDRSKSNQIELRPFDPQNVLKCINNFLSYDGKMCFLDDARQLNFDDGDVILVNESIEGIFLHTSIYKLCKVSQTFFWSQGNEDIFFFEFGSLEELKQTSNRIIIKDLSFNFQNILIVARERLIDQVIWEKNFFNGSFNNLFGKILIQSNGNLILQNDASQFYIEANKIIELEITNVQMIGNIWQCNIYNKRKSKYLNKNNGKVTLGENPEKFAIYFIKKNYEYFNEIILPKSAAKSEHIGISNQSNLKLKQIQGNTYFLTNNSGKQIYVDNAISFPSSDNTFALRLNYLSNRQGCFVVVNNNPLIIKFYRIDKNFVFGALKNQNNIICLDRRAVLNQYPYQ